MSGYTPSAPPYAGGETRIIVALVVFSKDGRPPDIPAHDKPRKRSNPRAGARPQIPVSFEVK
jgi:hypothetical protein